MHIHGSLSIDTTGLASGEALPNANNEIGSGGSDLSATPINFRSAIKIKIMHAKENDVSSKTNNCRSGRRTSMPDAVQDENIQFAHAPFDKRIQLVETSFKTVLASDLHEDDKAGRILSAMAFLTAAAKEDLGLPVQPLVQFRH